MNINTALKTYLKPLLNKEMTCIDATCGNGNDTLFLAENTKFVYAIDINESAISNTRLRLKSYSNFKTIHTSHVLMNESVSSADVILFNLGYLPYVENPTITNKKTTIQALNIANSILNVNGYLTICCYLKHDGGYDEYLAVENWIRKNNLHVIYTFQDQSRDLSPILFIIRKDNIC